MDEVVQWLTIFAPDTSDVEFRLREGGVRMFLPRITESGRRLAESFAALAAQGPRLDSTAIISQEEADRAAEAKAASALDTLAGELLAPAAADRADADAGRPRCHLHLRTTPVHLHQHRRGDHCAPRRRRWRLVRHRADS